MARRRGESYQEMYRHRMIYDEDFKKRHESKFSDTIDKSEYYRQKEAKKVKPPEEFSLGEKVGLIVFAIITIVGVVLAMLAEGTGMTLLAYIGYCIANIVGFGVGGFIVGIIAGVLIDGGK